MKSISHNLRRKLFLSALFLVFSTSIVSAQDVDPAPEDVNDEPGVPVDNYIYLGLIAGSFLAIRKLKKSETL